MILRPRSFVTPSLGVRLSQAEPLVPVVFGLLCEWRQRYRSSFPCSLRLPACWSIGRIPDMDIFGFLFCCAAVFGPGSGADVRFSRFKKNFYVACSKIRFLSLDIDFCCEEGRCKPIMKRSNSNAARPASHAATSRMCLHRVSRWQPFVVHRNMIILSLSFFAYMHSFFFIFLRIS